MVKRSNYKLRFFALLSLFLLALIVVSGFSKSHVDYKSYTADICIYGTTSAGVIAAYAAAKCGKSVILIGADRMIGGMTTGGLGLTDAGKKEAITGLARQFYHDVGKKYGLSEASWNFEPHFALEVFKSYLKNENIPVLLNRQLTKVNKKDRRILSLVFEGVGDRKGSLVKIKANQFLDCTYEGDLLAKAGISYVIGRESNDKYDETLNGYQLFAYHTISGTHQFPDGVGPYRIPGDSTSGLVWGVSENKPRYKGDGDKLIQAYNFRICLTNEPENRIPITRPDNYDSSHYILMARLFGAQPKMRNINDYFIWSRSQITRQM